MTTALYVDAKGAVASWVNAHPTLSGPGNPLPLGAHFQLLRSPFAGAYILITAVGGDRGSFDSRARISASIFALTEQAADVAAAAYLNALLGIEALRTPMGAAAVCLRVGDITGPLQVTQISTDPQRVVDADFYFVGA